MAPYPQMMGSRPRRVRSDVVAARRRDIDWLTLAGQLVLLAKITIVLLVFDPQAADSFSLVKSAFSHATGLVLAVLLVVLVLRDGWRSIPWSPIHLVVVALVLAFAASTLIAVDQTIALFGVWRRYLGLTQMLDYVCLYAAVVVLIRSSNDKRRLFTVTMVAAAIVVTYALAQWSGHDMATWVEGTTPISTIGQPDLLGGFGSVVFMTSFAWLVLNQSRLRPVGFAVAGLAIATAALIFALPVRNAILGTAAGSLALIVITFIEKSRARYVLLAAALIAGLLFVLSPASTRIRPDILALDPSAQSRIEVWSTSIRLIADRPVLGIGPDNFAAAYPSARQERSELILPGIRQNSTHNWFLYFATSAGLFGAIAVSLIVVLAVRAGVELARKRDVAALALIPLAAYLGQGLVDVNEIVIDMVFWISVGVLSVSSGRTLGQHAKGPISRPAPMYLAATIGIILVLWGGATQYSRLLASEALRDSQSLVARGRPLEAVQGSRAAIALDPRRGEYWSAFGLALAAAGNPSAAASAYLDAANIEPWEGSFWRDAALQKLAAGDRDRAFSLLERATQADPYDAESLDLLARLAFNRGDYQSAITAGERAVRIRPSSSATYEAPVQGLIRLRQWEDAERLLLQGIANTKSAHLQVTLARVYATTNRMGMAIEELRFVLEREPNNGEALALQSELAK